MSDNLVSSAIECANELISGLSCVHCSDVRFVMESSPIIQKHMDAYSKAQNQRLVKVLEFCKINNHKDNWGGKTYCRGHECPVCDKIEEAKALLGEVKKQSQNPDSLKQS